MSILELCMLQALQDARARGLFNPSAQDCPALLDEKTFARETLKAAEAVAKRVQS
jgi:hypothetical protein